MEQILGGVTFALFESVAFLFCVIGNMSVIYVMIRGRNLERKSNVFIISVAICELLFGLFSIPSTMYYVSNCSEHKEIRNIFFLF